MKNKEYIKELYNEIIELYDLLKDPNILDDEKNNIRKQFLKSVKKLKQITNKNV